MESNEKYQSNVIITSRQKTPSTNYSLYSSSTFSPISKLNLPEDRFILCDSDQVLLSTYGLSCRNLLYLYLKINQKVENANQSSVRILEKQNWIQKNKESALIKMNQIKSCLNSSGRFKNIPENSSLEDIIEYKASVETLESLNQQEKAKLRDIMDKYFTVSKSLEESNSVLKKILARSEKIEDLIQKLDILDTQKQIINEKLKEIDLKYQSHNKTKETYQNQKQNLSKIAENILYTKTLLENKSKELFNIREDVIYLETKNGELGKEVSIKTQELTRKTESIIRKKENIKKKLSKLNSKSLINKQLKKSTQSLSLTNKKAWLKKFSEEIQIKEAENRHKEYKLNLIKDNLRDQIYLLQQSVQYGV
jgi:predicted RNA-binding protein